MADAKNKNQSAPTPQPQLPNPPQNVSPQTPQVAPQQGQPPPQEQQPLPPPFQPPPPMLIVQSPKSEGLAALLAALFGPLGMMYAKVSSGLIMLVVYVALTILSFGLVTFIFPVTNLGCAVWAYFDAKKYNEELMRSIGQHPQGR